MAEQESSQFQTFTRRSLLKKSAKYSSAGALLWGFDKLHSGVKLAPNENNLHYLDSRPNLVSPPVTLEVGDVLLSNQPHKLFSPIGAEFFGSNPEILVAHRAGNSIKTIREGYEKGAQVFDIDANDVGGTIYGDHGLVPSIKIFNHRIHAPFVIDVDEKGFKLGRPKYTFNELVDFVQELSTPERPCGVAVELKRGEFAIPTLHTMFDTIETHAVPAVINVRNIAEFDTLMAMREMRPNEGIIIGTARTFPRA